MNRMFLILTFFSAILGFWGCGTPPKTLSHRELSSYLMDSLFVSSEEVRETKDERISLTVTLKLLQYNEANLLEKEIGELQGKLEMKVGMDENMEVLNVVDFQCDTLVANNTVFVVGAYTYTPASSTTIDVLFLPDCGLEIKMPYRKATNFHWSNECLHPLKDAYNKYFDSSHFWVEKEAKHDGWLIKTSFHEWDVSMFSKVVSNNSKSWKGKILRYKVDLSLEE